MSRTADDQAAATDGRVRATALPPDERRAGIVDATLALLLETGATVTTRQIAEASGIAEGTIFRVFADKDALYAAVADRVFDSEATLDAVEAIDLDQPLEGRLADAVEILQRRVETLWRFMTAVGMTKPPERHQHKKGPDAPEIRALAALFAPDADQLDRDPHTAAQLLRSLALACSHPALAPDPPLSAAEIVTLLLDGMRFR